MSRRTWTDAQLREAVATSRTQREVVTKLGLRLTGGANRDIHRHAQRLGLTLPMGNPGGGRERSWTDDQFRRAAHGAGSLNEVTRRLGLKPSGQGNKVLRRHAARLGITLPNGWPPSRAWREANR